MEWKDSVIKSQRKKAKRYKITLPTTSKVYNTGIMEISFLAVLRNCSSGRYSSRTCVLSFYVCRFQICLWYVVVSRTRWGSHHTLLIIQTLASSEQLYSLMMGYSPVLCHDGDMDKHWPISTLPSFPHISWFHWHGLIDMLSLTYNLFFFYLYVSLKFVDFIKFMCCSLSDLISLNV